MLSSRVWAPLQHCTVDTGWDLKYANSVTNYEYYFQSVDLSVVNVLNLARRGGSWCSYSVLDLGPGGSLRNGIFIVNASLDLRNSSCENISISVFDSVFGQLENITVLGQVNITIENQSSVLRLILSNFFGSVDPSISSTDRQKPDLFGNISTSLQYFVNGKQVSNNQDNVSQTHISLVSTFDTVFLNTSMNVIVNSSKLNLDNFADYRIKKSISEICNPKASIQFNTLIYSSLDAVDNAYSNLYVNSLNQYFEISNQVMNMSVMYFCENGSEDVMPQERSYNTAFYSEVETIAFSEASFPVKCIGGTLYSPASNTCIPAAQCQSLIFNSICASFCPESLYIQAQYCLNQCSQQQGFFSPYPENCTLCEVPLLASPFGCAENCSEYQYIFDFGCYFSCPYGSVLYIENSTCSYPVSVQQCGGLYLINVSRNQYNPTCSSVVPIGMFQISNDIAGDNCAVMVNISGYCENISECDVGQVLKSWQGVEFCQLSCYQGDVRNEVCASSCNISQYQIADFGSCNYCQSTQIDGGTNWKRDGGYCVSQCQFVNNFLSYLICENSSDLINCKYYSLFKPPSQYLCLSQCTALLLANGQQCEDSCPVSFVVNENGLQCASFCNTATYFFNSTLNNPQCLTLSCGSDNVSGVDIQFSGTLLRCEQTCENFSVNVLNYNQRCSSVCPENQSYVWNQSSQSDKVCISFCEFYSIFESRNQCVSICPIMQSYQLSDNYLCVSSCDFVTNRNVCASFCGYYEFENDSKMCLSSCSSIQYQIVDPELSADSTRCESTCSIFPYATFSINHYCVSACDGQYRFDDNFTCLSYCKYYSKSDADLICENSCTNYNGIDSLISQYSYRCVSACSAINVNLSINSKQCVSTCSGLTKYALLQNSQSICQSTCQFHYFIDSQSNITYCIENCSMTSNVQLTQNSFCVSQCHQSQQYLSGQYCLSSCKYYYNSYITSSYICTSSCGRYFQNDMNGNELCISFCPKFVSGFQCLSSCTYYQISNSSMVCQTNCSTFYAIDKLVDNLSQRCVSNCSILGYKYIFNQQCANQCTQLQFNSSFRCLSFCTYFSLSTVDSSTHNCISSCPNYLTIFQQNLYQCVSFCQFYAVILSSQIKQCAQKCNSYFVIHTPATECVSSCPYDFIFQMYESLQCVSSCLQYLIQNVCVSTCNLQFGFVNNLRICTSVCTELYKYVAGDRICASVCTQIFPFIYEGQNQFKCFENASQCPEYVIEFRCVSSCLSNNRNESIHFAIPTKGNVCSSTCLTIQNNSALQCVQECPKWYADENNYCMPQSMTGVIVAITIPIILTIIGISILLAYIIHQRQKVPKVHFLNYNNRKTQIAQNLKVETQNKQRSTKQFQGIKYEVKQVNDLVPIVIETTNNLEVQSTQNSKYQINNNKQSFYKEQDDVQVLSLNGLRGVRSLINRQQQDK